MTATALLQAIVSEQPALAKKLFEDLMQPKLVSLVDMYRDQIASQMFNPELHEDDDEEDDEDQTEDGDDEESDQEDEESDDEDSDEDEENDEDEESDEQDDDEEESDEDPTAFEKDNP